MKQVIVTSIAIAILAACAQQDASSPESAITSFDTVEMIHLALRDSCDGRFELKFTSALTQYTGKIARAGSYWTIVSASSPNQLEIAIVPPKTRGASLVATKKGSAWISVLGQKEKALSFLKEWNMPTIEAWLSSLIEHIRQQSEAESWEEAVPTNPSDAPSKP